MAKMKKRLLVMGLVCLSVMAMLQAGCASAPPTAFETAESLEGIAWVNIRTIFADDGQPLPGGILIMNDKTSGVYTDRYEKETAFTYTAVFDAPKRTFTGTITLKDGRVAEFSAKKAVLIGWALTAEVLEEGSFQYRTPAQLEDVYRQRKVKAEIVEKYGSEYRGLRGKVLKRESDNMTITFDNSYGLYQTTGEALQIIHTSYHLHSKDGVTVTLLRNETRTSRYAGVEGVGTFNIRVSGNTATISKGDTVTISSGTGAGTAFNGIYKVQ